MPRPKYYDQLSFWWETALGVHVLRGREERIEMLQWQFRSLWSPSLWTARASLLGTQLKLMQFDTTALQ